MSRIVAGRAGGRRLQMPTGESTRPTSDRVREAFFAALAAWNGPADAGAEHQLTGIAFLDLYAGSGAVGLEAASRGAGPVWLVDNDSKAGRVIRANIDSTGLSASLQVRGVSSVVDGPAERAFDVVWLDPPYPVSTATVEGVVARLFEHGWVSDDGVVVVERSTRGDEPVIEGHEQWSKKYGETTLYWISARAPEDMPDAESDATPSDEDF